MIEWSFLCLTRFLRRTKKNEKLLLVYKPAEVLNFEQKQLLAMVVFFIFIFML